jgi:hypothetical protein
MHDNRRPLVGAGAVVVALALVGCTNRPVQDADASPVGYYSSDYGCYVPDDVYRPRWWHRR